MNLALIALAVTDEIFDIVDEQRTDGRMDGRRNMAILQAHLFSLRLKVS